MTKKLLVALFAVGFVLSMASQGQAIIQGSGHDFTLYGPPMAIGPDGQAQLCVSCHTPHNADPLMLVVPLWNHETTSELFIPYDNTLSTQDSASNPPAGVSLACLSCHDDATNMDAYGAAIGLGTGTLQGLGGPATAALGTDLSNDHPISIAYDAGLIALDLELNDPAVAPSNIVAPGGTTIAADLLFADQLECASCHDVHDTGTDPASGYLLKVPMLNSQLCTTCHIK